VLFEDYFFFFFPPFFATFFTAFFFAGILVFYFRFVDAIGLPTTPINFQKIGEVIFPKIILP
jgi:hypothetical protein